MLSDDFKKLAKLKGDLNAVDVRISLAKRNLTESKQMLSPSLLALYKERARLEAEIAELGNPPDFTPNPGGSTPTPAAALFCA